MSAGECIVAETPAVPLAHCTHAYPPIVSGALWSSLAASSASLPHASSSMKKNFSPNHTMSRLPLFPSILHPTTPQCVHRALFSCSYSQPRWPWTSPATRSRRKLVCTMLPRSQIVTALKMLLSMRVLVVHQAHSFPLLRNASRQMPLEIFRLITPLHRPIALCLPPLWSILSPSFSLLLVL
jgi:hypothetical protein